MNAGVRLVQTYLYLNGYFTVTELPVIRALRGGGFVETTDLDVLAVRFPLAEYVVPKGPSGAPDDLRLEGDPHLVDDPTVVDVLIGEVKEGKARVNDALRSAQVLETVLRRVGCVPATLLGFAVQSIQERGEVRLDPKEAGLATRIRLVAFGDGAAGFRNGYTVVSLGHVARFVEGHLERYHDVLHPADLGDTVLGLLHLFRKLR
jgi:hypothetical protein